MNRITKPVLALAVVAAVAAASAAALQRPMSEEARINQITSLANVKQVTLGLLMYAQDADEVLPYPKSPKALHYAIYPYVKDAAAFKSANEKTEIRFNSALGGVKLKDIPEPPKTVVFYETKNWSDGRRAVGFADGSARLVPAIEWGRLAMSLLLRIPRTAEPLPADYGKGWNPEPLTKKKS